MDFLSAILLGLVQGLTEFLPISSSGHLVLSQHLLGYEGPNLAFDLMLHLGTLAAVIVYFRRDIGQMIGAALTRSGDPGARRWIIMIVVATLPTAIIGLALEDKLKALFGMPHIVSLMLWVTGILLLISDRVRIKANSSSKITIIQSLIIGTAQGLAIAPGISRSGATISAGIFTGLDRERAARFSFLLSIPAVIGASLLEAGEISLASVQNLPACLLGMATAFLSGYMAIDLLLRVIVKRGLWKFSVYLLIIGLVGLLLT